MKRVIYILTIIVCTVTISKAQYDPLYNQYVFNQHLINPAYTGAFDMVSLTVMSRAQWTGIQGAPITNSLSGHTSMFNNKGGVGLYVLNDQLGVSNNTEAFISFSYKVDFGNTKLAMGMQGGMIQYTYDYSELNMEQIDDPSFTRTEDNFTRPNFGAGLLLYGEYFYAGISVPRILNIQVNDGIQSSTRYQKHYYISGGVVFPLSNALKIKPSGLLRIVENKVSLDISTSLLITELIWAGIIIRDFNTFGIIAELQISDKIRIGYSMELPSNNLIANQFGTHELMVGFDFAPFNRQLLKRRYF